MDKICVISMNSFSEAFPAWTSSRAIKSLCNICFGVNILIPSASVGILDGVDDSSESFSFKLDFDRNISFFHLMVL